MDFDALFSGLDRHTLDGITRGSIYALVALGYTLVYGVMRLINFAHSEVFMVGTWAVLGVYTVARRHRPARASAWSSAPPSWRCSQRCSPRPAPRWRSNASPTGRCARRARRR